MTRFLIALLVPTLLLSAAPGKPIVVHPKNGPRVYGRIVEAECTDEHLVLRDLRSRAKRTIPWGAIKADQARELRVQLGFEVAEAEEEALLIDGHRIRNKAGSLFQGLLTNAKSWKSEGVCKLKTSDGDRIIRVSDIKDGPEAIRISALAVYTPEEIYAAKKKEAEPLDSARKHFQLAEICRMVDALEPALEHYEKAASYNDPAYSREKLERLVSNVKTLLANQSARDELKMIKRAYHYNKFSEGTRLAKAFIEKHAADKSLVSAAERIQADGDSKRDKYYTTSVPRLVRDAVKDVLLKHVKETEELTLRQAQEFAGGEVSADESASRLAVMAVGARLEIPADDVLRYWNARSKTSIQRAFYRDGTFVVVADLGDVMSKAPKVKRSKDGPRPPKPSKALTREKWWERKVASRKYSELGQWMYAFWAEKSGMVEVLDPKESTCQSCAGKGFMMKIHRSSAGTVPYADRCQTCHTAKHFRIVMFK